MTDMLSALKFVSGAINNRSHEESHRHLMIKDRRVTAYNGFITMSSPIDRDLHIKPKADLLIKAVETIAAKQKKDKDKEDKTTFTYSDKTARLNIKSGAFRTSIACLPNEADIFPAEPEGELIAVTPELIKAIIALDPLMGIDATRQWSMGIRIARMSAFATNNIVLVERWHGANFPYECVIPAVAIEELIRVSRVPTHIQMTQSSLTFWFDGGMWLRTQLVAAEWPAHADTLLSVSGAPVALPDDFYENLATLKKFTDLNVVFFRPGIMSTSKDEDGTSIDIPLQIEQGAFLLNKLAELDGIATAIDFSAYPKPCPFKGHMLRGVIVGQRY